ncbi:LytTR family DNA-binding domain-containing protein [Parabacteroides sp. AM08-6]|uniref:LytR/AlgR family response regulator transcription factor n=1 Tax=Parabacteroides sp. AM08-6 TaxID=2292053 RepID=UPI000EFFAC49|nr:LytTR family DNA-binding domain-containing protein [Parabacteroides sp. AM08-6]RHJ79346.1 DNA-binding response regulator [Parabacteroides sp. AM08-6]
MKLTCAIIDDEPLATGLLGSYVDKTPFLELKGAYNSAVTALGELTSQPVDLLFLDIQMPELSGMEFSRMLGTDTRIIFTTAFGQYALDSYKVNALDYLLKPISYPDFLKSANKALQWYELLRGDTVETADNFQIDNGVHSHLASHSSVESIFIKTEYKLVQIELRKILYIEGLKDYVKIFVEDEPRPVLSLMSMKVMEEMLPPDRFIRVHRSFIVQPEKIKVIERNRIVYGKEYIPISDNYKQKFMEFLSQRSLLP